MTPHPQLIKHDPENGAYGDCQRTCIAVILDLHPSEVPHFCDNPLADRDSPDWWHKRQTRWLAERGLAEAPFAYYSDEPLAIGRRAGGERGWLLVDLGGRSIMIKK